MTLLGRILLWVARGAVEPRGTVQQMARQGVDSLSIVLTSGLFSGMVLAYQTARQLLEFGAQSFVGGLVAVSLSREAAPVFTAVVIAGRVGSGIAAELGSMAVTEQIDALRALAIDPARYLGVPRALAGITMMPVLTLISNVVGYLGGQVVAATQGVNPNVFLTSVQRWLGPHDLTSGLLKAAVFGLIITVVGTYYGLRTTGGADGVGRSATGSVVASILLVLVANYFLDVLLF